MQAAEAAARQTGKTLLVLDTASAAARLLRTAGLGAGRHHPRLRAVAGRRAGRGPTIYYKALSGTES